MEIISCTCGQPLCSFVPVSIIFCRFEHEFLFSVSEILTTKVSWIPLYVDMYVPILNSSVVVWNVDRETEIHVVWELDWGACSNTFLISKALLKSNVTFIVVARDLRGWVKHFLDFFMLRLREAFWNFCLDRSWCACFVINSRVELWWI